MNADILKGTWLVIRGSAKEELAKLTDNDLGVISALIPSQRLRNTREPLPPVL